MSTIVNFTQQQFVKATKLDFDLAIIGGGPGGYVAAIYAAKKGLKVALIEKARLGGTCLNVGCIPTKTLIKSAEVCKTVNKAATFGIDIEGSVAVNMRKVIERKNAVVDKLVGGIEYLMSSNKVTTIEGVASFIDDKTIAVRSAQDYVIKAKDIIIATGSNIAKPNIEGIDLPFVINSTSALDLDVLPQSIAIVGGGVIGLEFAFLYANFGVEVTVIEYLDRLLNTVDSDISRLMLSCAKEIGIKTQLSARVTKLQGATNGQGVVTFEKDGNEYNCVADKVLIAIGRAPNLDGLNIGNTQVELNDSAKGIKVGDDMRTNVEHIYAIGDVNNRVQLAHAASRQGIVAVDNILGGSAKFNANETPSVIFTSPEVATIGVSQDFAKANGINVKVGKFYFMGNGKALTMNETKGFVRLIKDSDGVIIGGSVVGADASTIISSIALAVANKLTDLDVTKTIFPHPTTSEALYEAAMDLSVGALHK